MTLAALATGAASGQGWSGAVEILAFGQSASGNPESFRSQEDLDEGAVLRELDLRYTGTDGVLAALELRAFGFGGAEPSQGLKLDLRLTRPWRFEVAYDRRESFFALAESEDLGLRTEDWAIERWRAGAVWDGWRPARLALDLRATERSGRLRRPTFALNDRFPILVDLDESMREAAFSLETRTLPVTLSLEQSVTTYERENGRAPADARDLEGDNPSLFTSAEDRREERREVPVTRLVATYRHPRAEVVGSLLWSPADLDGSGLLAQGFDIQGGEVGRFELLDDVVTSAEVDHLVGNVRLGFRLSPRWVLRLRGDLRDVSTDAALVGERLLRITNPFGNVFDLPALLRSTTFIDVSDESETLTLEWADGGWTAWAGGFVSEREVSWRRDDGEPGIDVRRQSDGALVGGTWSGRGVSTRLEYERGTFDRFVFRTDPETIERWRFRLRARLRQGWEAHAHGRFEEADNPPEVAGVDRASDAWGAGVSWSSEDAATGFGLDLDLHDLTALTDLELPGGGDGLSRYDLSLVSASIHGRGRLGRCTTSASATRLDDSGDSWPLEAWIASVRAAIELESRWQLVLAGEYRSYDEGRANGDDFDVTRYGLGFRWSFE